jgi:hypothetical protein
MRGNAYRSQLTSASRHQAYRTADRDRWAVSAGVLDELITNTAAWQTQHPLHNAIGIFYRDSRTSARLPAG